MSKELFTAEGKLNSFVRDLIRAGRFVFVPSIIELNERTRRYLKYLPLDNLPDGKIYCLNVHDKEYVYGHDVYFICKTSAIIQRDTEENKFPEVSGPIVLAMIEAIQEPKGSYSKKAYELFDASNSNG